jgi:murein DD-endopeptidase MepM/ murein hydrolase activator NlpD
MKNILKIIVIILIIAGAVIGWRYFKTDKVIEEADQIASVVPTTYTRSLDVIEGSTYGVLMEEAGVGGSISGEILQASQEVYGLESVRLGRKINLVYDIETDELEKLIYRIDSEDELHIGLTAVTTTATSTDMIWQAERVPIPYETKIKTVEGVIETSMYEAAMASGFDEVAVINFADVFQWSVDFAWEVQKGDSFKFIYVERYRDGEYIMPGKIIAGLFVNEGEELYAFARQDSEGNEGYFDEAGESVEKVFLKAPLAFKYISSGFSNSRYLEAFNISGHRAIDYAATYGTPIRSVGDGKVVFAGWQGGYGNKVGIRHNSTYTTNYAHMSKIAVGYGQKVSQGQTIGYVGSTGYSTGPHLHYEMVKHGTKINPFWEEFPSIEGIAEENLEKYLGDISDLKNQLN